LAVISGVQFGMTGIVTVAELFVINYWRLKPDTDY
jgi:hypothetical protein